MMVRGYGWFDEKDVVFIEDSLGWTIDFFRVGEYRKLQG